MLKYPIFFLFAVFICSTILAQQNQIQKTDTVGFYRLTDVVVTATKTRTNTLELANSISIIDSAEIANKNSFRIFDTIKNEYGLSFSQQGNKSGVSNVFIRGANSSHTLVLIDGVEVNLPNDPSNFYDFANLSADNVNRIEVLRGPQSTLYGSDALAGVINIITEKGSGRPGLRLSTEGGSYNTFKGTISSLGKIEKFNYSVALSRIKSDGFSAASERYGNTEKDGYQSDNISANLGYYFSEKLQSNIILRFNKSTTELDQSFSSPTIWDDPTYVFDQEEFFVRGQGQLSLLDNLWDQKFGLTFFRNVRKYSYDTSAASIYYSRSLYDGRKYKADWQNDFHLIKNNVITAGVEFEVEESLSEFYQFTYLSPPDYASIIPKKNANTLGIFLQDQLKLGESFFGTIGFRYDYHNKFGSAITYRIAPAYVFWETGTKFKATVGTGFKAPSLFYLYDPAYGNENLDPEKSLGWDVGIEQFFWKNSASVGITYFNYKFEDMFGFDPITFKTININKAETNGVEIFARASVLHGLELKSNFTYTNAKDKSENSTDFNKKLVRRPEHKAGLYITYSFIKDANANIEFIYIGSREEPDFVNYPDRIIMPDYLLINLAAHYDIFSFLSLKIRIENLLDKQYEEVYGFGTPGFSIYGGLSFNLQ